jgi:hypothetical protein
MITALSKPEHRPAAHHTKLAPSNNFTHFAVSHIIIRLHPRQTLYSWDDRHSPHESVVLYADTALQIERLLI